MVLWEEMSVRCVWMARVCMVVDKEMIWGSMEGMAAKVGSWFWCAR